MSDTKKPPPLAIKPVPFIEAMDYSRKRGVVLPDVYYGKLQGIERAEAYSIAGIASLDQLQGALYSLSGALAGGNTFEQWKKDILKAPDVLALPKHRLDNIFRTNIQGAYARGRCVHIEKNKHVRTHLVYSAINDSRTRPAHTAMNGHVAPVSDAVWKTWTPPCGYRCRCTVISQTEAQAKAMAEKDKARLDNDPDAAMSRAAAIAIGPDEGWDYSPCERMGEDVIKSAKEKSARYHAALKAKVEAIEKQAKVIASADDPDKWVKIGGQKGSNPGGLYETADGRRYYVKWYTDHNQARSEVAAHAINDMLGLEAPKARLIIKDGRPAIASEWIDGAQQASIGEMTKTAARRRELARIYAGAALTKNWDVVGQTIDNIVLTKQGRLAVIDAGGAFKFRARGGAKVYAAGPVEELDSLLNTNINKQAASVFRGLSEKERATAIRALDGITKKQIADAFGAAGFGETLAKELTEATWARKKWMVESTKSVPQAAAMTPAEISAAMKAHADKKTWEKSSRMAKAKRGHADQDRAVLSYYTSHEFGRINRAIRGEDKMTPGIEAISTAIISGASRQEKHVGILFRGIRFDTQRDAHYLRIVEAAKKGKVTGAPIESIGHFSASRNRIVADGFGALHSPHSNTIIFKIEAKGWQGVDVADVSHHGTEDEILFPHTSRFVVTDIEEDDYFGKKVTIIHAKECEDIAAIGAIKFSLPQP